MRNPNWSREDIDEAARLWAKGTNVALIAIAFDKSEDAINRMARRNRNKFPLRKIYRKTHPSWNEPRRRIAAPANDDVPASAPTMFADRVTRSTITGVRVTLPRVSFIDGRYQEAAE